MRTDARSRAARRLRVALRRVLLGRRPAWSPTDLSRWLRVGGLGFMLVVLLVACAPASETELVPRTTLFIGIDVSESFQRGRRYDDAMAFASRYIHGHLNGLGDLEEPRTLFVGSIGGERPGEPQAFHPIHDFEAKTPGEIEADLRDWFPPDDQFTDFNAFFQRAATLVKRQNLALAPVTLVLFTDGVPDVGAADVGPDDPERYARIDLDPLEYLARNVTVRVLYPDPSVAVHWERDVPRDRVRMWTVNAVVMEGWREQLREPTASQPAQPEEPQVAISESQTDSLEEAGGEVPDSTVEGVRLNRPISQTAVAASEQNPRAPVERSAGEADGAPSEVLNQPALWRWIEDNVDFRVRRTIL